MPTMGGEDFAEYSLPDHSIPAVDFHVGAVSPEKIAASKETGAPPLPAVHSSKFAPVPEPTIRLGLVAMTTRGARLDSELGTYSVTLASLKPSNHHHCAP